MENNRRAAIEVSEDELFKDYGNMLTHVSRKRNKNVGANSATA